MEIPVHMCLELLTAADFLGIDSKSTASSSLLSSVFTHNITAETR